MTPHVGIESSRAGTHRDSYGMRIWARWVHFRRQETLHNAGRMRRDAGFSLQKPILCWPLQASEHVAVLEAARMRLNAADRSRTVLRSTCLSPN